VSQTAKLTGRSKSSVREAAQMNKAIPRLAETAGTSLGSIRERRALAKLSEAEQDGVINRAKAGEEVSARAVLEQKKAPTNTEKKVKPKKGAPSKNAPQKGQVEKSLMEALQVIIDMPKKMELGCQALKLARRVNKKIAAMLPPAKTAKPRPEELVRRAKATLAEMDRQTELIVLREQATRLGFELKAVAGAGGDR
jgi:hypothetical protein